MLSPINLQGYEKYYGYGNDPCENATDSLYLYGHGHVCFYFKVRWWLALYCT
jgi:hypothetical protein